jgi:hypothetical protein
MAMGLARSGSLRWHDVRGWRLADASSDAVHERSEDDLRDGFYVALKLWAWHLFDMTAFDSAEDERDGEH